MLEFDRLKQENEELKRAVDWYRIRYFAGWEQVGRWRAIAEKWQGKYMITKHENNKLRKELWDRRQKALSNPFSETSQSDEKDHRD